MGKESFFFSSSMKLSMVEMELISYFNLQSLVCFTRFLKNFVAILLLTALTLPLNSKRAFIFALEWNQSFHAISFNWNAFVLHRYSDTNCIDWIIIIIIVIALQSVIGNHINWTQVYLAEFPYLFFFFFIFVFGLILFTSFLSFNLQFF